MTPHEKIEEKKADAAAAQAEARAQALSLANDFREVFEIPRRRSDAQDRVLAHLRACSGGQGSAFRPQGEGDGIKILVAGIQRDGARSIIDVIEFQVEKSMKAPRPPRAKPSVRK
jgi:hypothetical protein